VHEAQTGFFTYLGFFKFFGFLSKALPIHDLPFVLMTERGKEWFKSPPFDKRKEVKT